ncbi:MAG: DUF1854 domain-containing protein [Clostridia bacterium]|nr:DUF1854 domain-containing protein [Clostridia bacterium]
MSRNFIDGNEIRITVKDKIFCDVEFFTGEKFENLEPRRLFPVSGLSEYITFLDENGEEQFIIRKLDNMEPTQKELLLGCLEEYYRIPKITRLISRSEKHKIWLWNVETDRGVYTFEIINHIQSMKMFYDKRILIKDGNDNRYEIPNIYELDKRSQKLILPDM